MSLDKRHTEIIIGAIRFESHVEAYKHYGINRRTYLSRIGCGWDEHSAMTTPVRKIARGE